MGLSIVSILCAVVVSNLHHQSIMDRDVPAGLRNFARRINRWVMVSPRRRPILTSSSNVDSTPDLKTPLRDSYSSINMTFRNETPMHTFEMGYANGGAVTNKHECNNKNTSNPPSNSNSTTAPSPVTNTRDGHCKKRKTERPCNAGAEDLLRNLCILIQRQEALIKNKESTDVNKEWHEIAEILDRFLFWLYFIINFVVTIVILVLVPLGKTVNMR